MAAGGSNFFIYQAGICLNYFCGDPNQDSLKPWVRVYNENGSRSAQDLAGEPSIGDCDVCDKPGRYSSCGGPNRESWP